MTADDLDARAAERLERAADYLRRNGHCKGQRFVWRADETISACVMGALAGCTKRGGPVVNLLDFNGWHSSDALARHLGLSGLDYLAEWNDHPDRTPDEVVEALLATAKKLRNGEPLWAGTHR